MGSNNDNEKKVFFMIGSQRSGSNWLRTMLDQREDLVGPHPPHVMREFMPIISKFGSLSHEDNFNILVDHVCTFVERNQVPWNDKYGQRIIFCRQSVCDQAKASCKRLERQEGEDSLTQELYLLSIFDALMDFFAEANGKELWLCKSMGMSAYHASLLKFYGKERLRYIYLVRDPRDVAMSFMNTPVGDKHYYAIVKKWAKLQDYAMAILEDAPEIIFNTKYEELLENKEDVVRRIYDFMGARHFGMVNNKQASVMTIAPVAESVNQAKCGSESFKAHRLSYQFKNLCRGQSFAVLQMAKWKDPQTGLKRDELMIIESLAYDAMKYFGYEAKYVKKACDVVKFTESEMSEYATLNKIGIQHMYENLERENIEDYNRRIHQAEVLKMDAKLLSNEWSIDDSVKASMKKESILKQLNDRRVVKEYTQNGILEGFGTFLCGAYSQQGYKSSKPMQENQDSFDIRIADDDQIQNHFFAVFDGHGLDGGPCSQLCRTNMGDVYLEQLSKGSSIKTSMMKAHTETHRLLTGPSSTVNAELSGATSVVASLAGGTLSIAHAGDSVVILGSKSSKRFPTLLTKPHDLSDKSEVKRIKRKGGLVMSPEEYDEKVKGRKVTKKSSEQDRVLRIWSSTSNEKIPGCAFTRSIGDVVAHEIGVSEKPEFKKVTIQDDDVIVIVSDGVTEYLDHEDIVQIASTIDDPAKAAEELVKKSCEMWAEKTDYCDDVTAMVIFISNDDDSSWGSNVECAIEKSCGTKSKLSSMSSSLSSVRRLFPFSISKCRERMVKVKE